MRRGALIAGVALAGCNQLFGLEPTALVDAAQGTPVDAPPACPAIGTPPGFGGAFVQRILMPCVRYSEDDAGALLAVCPDNLGTHHYFVATAEEEPSEVGVGDGLTPYSVPVRVPDANLLVMPEYSGSSNQLTTRVQQLRFTDGSYELDQVLFEMVTAQPCQISPPTRRRDDPADHRRMLVAVGDVPMRLAEYRETSTGWAELASYSIEQLLPGAQGVALHSVQLTSDGTRAVVHVGGARDGEDITGVYYTDRPTLGNRFAAMVELALPTFSELPAPFMRADCSRLYFSALGSVFYAPLM